MNYKDLPEINKKIRYLEKVVSNRERDINNVKRFRPDSELVTAYSEMQAETVNEIDVLLHQRDDIIAQMDMNERTKAVLLMHYDAGMPWKQVAEHEGVSLRTIYRIAGEK